jgi:hypothetical protein
MDTLASELHGVYERLQEYADQATQPAIEGPLKALERTAEDVGRASSGSWLGYHALVYYQNLKLPPPGAHFSAEWGLVTVYSVRHSQGEWVEYPFDQVKDAILTKAGNPDLGAARQLAEGAKRPHRHLDSTNLYFEGE